ncbi:MAG: DNA polymerase III subunit delta [Kiritimatiellia bacterium]|jgi:DNA polymerase III delta subunit
MADPSAILIVSPDDYLLAQKTKEVLDKLVPEENRMFGLEIVDCAVDTVDAGVQALRQVQGSLVQQSFFSEGKTVWMRDIAFFDSGRLQKSTTLSAAIESFCNWLKESGIPEGFKLLATSTSIPKNLRFYKTFETLAKQKTGRIVNVEAPSERDAVDRALAFARDMGLPLSKPVAAAFVARVGAAPRQIASELEKLAAYTGGKAPTYEDVEAICTLNIGGEFWDLTDAFGQRDLSKTIKVLHNLYEKRMEPVMLVMQIQARLNELYLLCDSLASRRLSDAGRWSPALSEEDAAAVAALGSFNVVGKSSWRLGGLLAQARKWTPAALKRARTAMIKAHERMVSVSVDAKSLLEMAIIDALRSP